MRRLHLTEKEPIIWVVQKEAHKGNLHAALGVAERLTGTPKIVWVEDIANYGGIPGYIAHLKKKGDSFKWPDIVIGCTGVASSVEYLLDIKRLSEGSTFTVMLRNPLQRHEEFDLIVMPKHQAAADGKNMVSCTGIASRINAETLRQGKATWQDEFQDFAGKKLVAVMIGGDSSLVSGETGGGAFTPEDAKKLGRELVAIAKQHNAALLITDSQRTPEKSWHALCNEIRDVPAYLHHYAMKNARGNPYFGLLALADILVPTADSMSMCMECCSTGKPVYIAGHDYSNVRSDHLRLVDELIASGHAKTLEGHFEPWEHIPPPLDTAGEIAEIIKTKLQARRSDRGHYKAIAQTSSAPGRSL